MMLTIFESKVKLKTLVAVINYIFEQFSHMSILITILITTEGKCLLHYLKYPKHIKWQILLQINFKLMLYLILYHLGDQVYIFITQMELLFYSFPILVALSCIPNGLTNSSLSFKIVPSTLSRRYASSICRMVRLIGRPE